MNDAPLRVLIVDDHAVVREGIARILGAAGVGWTVGEASGGFQALDWLRQQRADVAIVDLSMPGMSGLELVKRIRAEFGRLPVLAALEPLDKDAMIRILTEPRNALVRQYEKLFALEGVQLNLLPEAVDFIAEKALDYKLGARGLRSLCEAILTDAMFELPTSQKDDQQQLDIDRAYAQEKLEGSRIGRLKAA